MRGLILKLTIILTITNAAYAQSSYTVSKNPELTIKSYKTDNFVHIGSVATFNNYIVVQDQASLTLFTFDLFGNPLFTFGSGIRGTRPGEFISATWLGECEPRAISILDMNNKRVTRVSIDGKLIGIESTADMLGTEEPYAAYCKSNVIVVVNRPTDYLNRNKIPGPHRSLMRINIKSPNKKMTSLGEFPGQERFFWRLPNHSSEIPRPFGKPLAIAISDRIFIGTADSFYINVFDLNGKKLKGIRYNVPVRKFTDHDKKIVAKKVSTSGRRSAEMLANILESALPETIAVYDRFITSGDSLWVQLGHGASDTTYKWLGFDKTGKYIGSISTPIDLYLFQINSQFVLGKWTESEWVESVRRYRLMKIGN